MSSPATAKSARLELLRSIALPFALFVAHGAFFSGWQIDDAGISYAYARNLAGGDGLVAQPGLAPVEGFTNLLWVFLLAPCLRFVEAPELAARALSYVSVFAGFLLLAAAARSWFPRRWVAVTATGLSITSLITGFPAWTLSGLENGLLVALLSAFLAMTTGASDTSRAGAAAGVLWLLLFATRPETAPLALVPAAALALRGHARSSRPYAVTVAVGLFGLTGFRALYFGDVLPNTYYAKSAPCSELLGSIGWTGTTGLLVGLAGGLTLFTLLELLRKGLRRGPWPVPLSVDQAGRVSLWLTLVISYLAFEALPTDWMPEGRFATALYLLAPIAALGLARRATPILAAAGVVLVLGAGGYAWKRTPSFSHAPPAPFSSVIDLSQRLRAVGDALGTRGATTVLLPDIGGALWANRFEIVDLGGLVDRRIGRALGADDLDALHDYVFDARQPDLIWVHSFWAESTRLESDVRLGRDYEPLFSDEGQTLYVRSATAASSTRRSLRAAFTGEPDAPRLD